MNKLSIIIPTYNSNIFLPELLIRLDMLKDVELVFVDDGSQDDTVAVLRNFSENRKNIQIVTKKHSGVSDSRNVGIRKSTGKYLMFIDSDDLINSVKLQNNIDNIIENTEDGMDVIAFSSRKQYKITDDFFEIVKGLVLNNGFYSPSPCSKFYKKSLITKNNILFDTKVSVGEDMLFNLKVLIHSNNIQMENQGFYLYRYNVSSVTKTNGFNIYENHQYFLQDIKELFNRNLHGIEFNKLLGDVIIQSWVTDSVKIIRKKINRQELNQMTKEVRQSFTISSIIQNGSTFKQKGIRILLLMKLNFIIKIMVSKVKKNRLTQFVEI